MCKVRELNTHMINGCFTPLRLSCVKAGNLAFPYNKCVLPHDVTSCKVDNHAR